MASYKELIVWQKSMELVEEIYRLVRLLPKEETYALSDQMKRSAISIPSNIAEGHGRNSSKDFSRFIFIAQGSKAELETQIEICIRLDYLTEQQIKKAVDLCNTVGKMLRNLVRSLNKGG
ncbi:MAG: four helix bundle protein [Ruminococcus sp.]|nr:four helix bundle protein [Ruminococcus sp.]